MIVNILLLYFDKFLLFLFQTTSNQDKQPFYLIVGRHGQAMVKKIVSRRRGKTLSGP